MPIVLNGTTGITTPSYGGADLAEYIVPVTAFKNRIINGACVIDQRNAGASVSTTTVGSRTYSLDRWNYLVNQASKFTIQQNAGSVTPPTGFTNYLGCTSTSAYSVGTSDYFLVGQTIEGFNTADLRWGTANAQTVTLSFWVRSSLTGTFGGVFRNSANDRFYPFTYTISSANTWEQKSVTVAGDTSGTWVGATNGVGLDIIFSLGVGSALSGTAGAWTGTAALSVTGATSVVGTNGATFYITGVQLEVGSTATSFDYRPYGTELALCQRYYETIGSDAAGGLLAPQGYGTAGVQINQVLFYKVTKRASPTVTKVGTWNLTNLTGQPNVFGAGVDNVLFYATATGTGGSYAQNSNAGNYVTISAEL